MTHLKKSERNNFGALRLIFASLVIVSHSPQELDGDFRREPLMRLFHTVTLGDIAVAGFFIVSGYLVTASYQSSRSVLDYLIRRALRIYPAFVAASLVCIVIVAPLVKPGAQPHPQALMMDMISLRPPGGRHEFAALPWSMLDVPMWSIGFEARCYALVAIAGTVGALRHRSVMLTVTAALIFAYAGLVMRPNTLTLGNSLQTSYLQAVTIDPDQAIYLTGLFCDGVTFRLFEDDVPLNALGAGVCGLAMLAWFCFPTLASLALSMFFPYVIFWAALKMKKIMFYGVGRGVDISYGVYLYAWPISWLIILHHPLISPTELTAATLLLASCAGALSWWIVEQPALSLKARGTSYFASHKWQTEIKHEGGKADSRNRFQ